MSLKLLYCSTLGDSRFPLSKKNQLKLHLVEEMYRNGSKSIPELSKSVKLSTPTVTRAIDELLSEGLILEEGIGDSSGGRRPNLYGLNPESRYILGIDICRFVIRIGLFNFNNQPAIPVKTIKQGLDTSNEIIKLIKQEAENYINEAKVDKKKIMGVGIALPGLLDTKTGISYSYINEDVPINKLFENIFHLPVFVEHDTKAMTLGEQAFGMARGKDNVLCLNIGEGIGLGMVFNGKLYHGNSGFAGEFGHIQVDPKGELCYCGKIGCLETLASGTKMIKTAKAAVKNGAITLISTLVEDDVERINTEVILEAAQRGDQFAIDLIASIGEHLGRGIAVLIHLMNPELIIIGGELTSAEHYLVDPIQQNLNKFTIAKIKRDAQIITSGLGNMAGLMGTVALVMNNVFKQN